MHSMSPSPWRETMAKNRVIHKNGVSPTINMDLKMLRLAADAADLPRLLTLRI